MPKNRKNKFKKSKKSIIPKYIVVFIIVPVISLVIYSIIYLIVYSRIRSNIHKKSIKEINSNSGTDKFKNITELLISNNDIDKDKDKNNNNNNNNQLNLNKYADKVNYIDGKLIWNNEYSLEERKIRDEISTYNNIQITFENKQDFVKRENPLITLVITIYNQENNIKSIYSSIQHQELKDIEIIFVDDASTDESPKIIKYLMEKDNRIVYLRNEVNKRAYYSRYEGVLNAKGKYVLVIDPDDLLINNILLKAYETASKYDLDIVQFYLMIGYPHSPHLWPELKYTSGIIKGNAEIRKIFYYGISRNLVDKLIKREIYIKSIKFVKPEYYDLDYHVNDDDTAFFSIIHVAESYGFLDQIGYFYILKYPSAENDRKALERVNSLFQSMSNIMRYFYFQSDNNTLEKTNICFKYFQKSANNFGNRIEDITDGFDNITNVLDIYLNSTYFDDSQKKEINDFKSKIINRKNRVKPVLNQTL